jgi:hypothetical protein
VLSAENSKLSSAKLTKLSWVTLTRRNNATTTQHIAHLAYDRCMILAQCMPIGYFKSNLSGELIKLRFTVIIFILCHNRAEGNTDFVDLGIRLHRDSHLFRPFFANDLVVIG